MTYSATYFQNLGVLKNPCAFTLITACLCLLSLKPINYFKCCKFFLGTIVEIPITHPSHKDLGEDKCINNIHEAVRCKN